MNCKERWNKTLHLLIMFLCTLHSSKRHLSLKIVHKVVSVLQLELCVKQRAVETTRSALCMRPNATVMKVSFWYCFTLKAFYQWILIIHKIFWLKIFDEYIMHSLRPFLVYKWYWIGIMWIHYHVTDATEE